MVSGKEREGVLTTIQPIPRCHFFDEGIGVLCVYGGGFTGT